MSLPAALRHAVPDLETALSGEDKLELRVWLRLLTCSTMIERRVRAGLRRQFGQTLPRFDFLAQLDRARDGLTMGELSGRLMVSNGNITGLAERLEQEGLIVRETAAHDRRTQRVRLTDAGQRLFDAMAPAHRRWVEDMLVDLDRAEMQKLLLLLGDLKHALQGAADTQGEETE